MPLLRVFLRELLINIKIGRLFVSEISDDELEHLIFLSGLQLDSAKFPPMLKEFAQPLQLNVNVF